MDINRLEEVIKEGKYDLYKKQAYLKSTILPSITLVHENRSKENVGLSKMGGHPEVPVGFKWPKHEFGDYRFALQLNLNEIEFSSQLPKRGMLSVFIANDEDNNVFYGDDDYAKVFYFDESEPLETYVNTNLDYSYRDYCLRINMEEAVDIPYREELFKNRGRGIRGLNKRQLAYVCDKVPAIVNKKTYSYLLGYPYYNTLAYDPRRTDEWTSLLTLRKEPTLSWDWDWNSFLMLFIEKDKLAKGDFSNIKSDLG
jgi:uncharacterized protein YwqG